MLPKYTVNFTLTEKKSQNEKEVLLDCDYPNMLKLRDELEAAVKSLDSPLSKKVFNMK